jgi:D-alanyl-D-alanine carboxypeptidase/D-alanyl-D-alanine-endopeptidase (penicillin-binding protein 4)
VLVGGGDPTLNSLPAPKQSVYPGSARVDDLAAQVKSHVGQITHVFVDTSRYAGSLEAPGWDQPSASQNNYAPIQPVMLDGGRLDPTKADTPRTYTPAINAGQALATRLGLPASSVSTGTAPQGAQVLGEVHSAQVTDLVANTLQISDNVLAEVLGREVARADGKPATFQGATQAVLDVLQRNGFNVSGATLSDSSGLSPGDRVQPKLLADIMRVASGTDPSDPRTAKLRPLLDGLPIAGSSVGEGTLAGRYQAGSTAAGKGWVRAKTGTLGAEGVNTLAGVVLDSDGRLLVFALMTTGAGSTVAAQTALDTITSDLRGCGCR